MGLITCPDCQNQVSDRAKTCIHCGAPLIEEAQTAKIIIKVGTFFDQRTAFGCRKVGIYNKYDRKLATIKEGGTTSLNVDSIMEIYAKDESSLLPVKTNLLKVSPNKNTRLQVYWQKGVVGFKLLISEIDVIDSW